MTGAATTAGRSRKNEISVAQTVEEALEKVLGTRTKVVGCGRTDAGVHALRYCANFHAETNIPMERMPLAVNSVCRTISP